MRQVVMRFFRCGALAAWALAGGVSGTWAQAATAPPGAAGKAPALADFLPAPPAALAAAAAPCSTERLRTSAELGPLDEAQDARAQLLRAWGQRRLPWSGGADGCIDWARVVRAWQQASGGVVNGELGLADLDRLQSARMAQFASYREALTAWQQGRVAAINAQPAPPVPPPDALPPALMEPRGADSLADSASQAARIAGQSESSIDIDCAWAADVLTAALGCKAAIDSGRLPPAKLAAAHQSLALHYLRQNDLPRTLAQLTRSLEIDGKRGSARVFRGDMLRRVRAYAQAQADLDAAIGLLQADKIELARAFANRAVLMVDVGNFRAARDDNEEALRHDPTNKLALANRRPIQQRLR